MLPTLVRLRSLRTLALVAGVLAAAGCKLATAPPVPQIAAIQGGNNQTAPAGTQFPSPLAVIVVSQYGFVIADVAVNWTITSGGGSLSAATSTTDQNGIATVTYTAGPTAGTALIGAEITRLGKLTFTETIN